MKYDLIAIAIYLLMVSIFDIRSRKIPLFMIGMGVLVDFILIICKGQFSISYCVSGILPGAVILIIAIVTRSIGIGDGIVISQAGLIMGYHLILETLMWSFLFTAGFSMVLIIISKSRKKTRIPFVPFLAAGFFMSVLI